MEQCKSGNNNKTVNVSALNNGVLDLGNSTSLPLLAGETFTGVGIRVTDYVEVIVAPYSDVASATDGLKIQYSSDNVNWTDHGDPYTVPANTGKNYSVQRVSTYYRTVYKNGITDQTEFRLTSILNKVHGKDSSHRTSDEITSEDDATLNKSITMVATNNPAIYRNADVQNPLAIDGDSVYMKDLDIFFCTAADFVKDADPTITEENVINSMVSDVYIEKLNSTSDAVKTVFLQFKRPVLTTSFGINAGPGGDFSNTKITLAQGDFSFVAFDDSADSTKHQIFLFPITPIKFSRMTIEFFTTDPISIGLIGIFKNIEVAARLQALKPDGTITNIDATAGGNLKISLEEFETTFNEDPLPVTDMMLFIARGLRIGMSKVNKYGQAKDGVQLTPTDIWDRADAAVTQQIWLAPTAARIHTIVSSSISDDGTPEGAGIGAQSVRIWYLPDWDTKEAFENVILNGTTGVAMLNSAVIVNRMKVIPVGTTYAINLGIITATAAVDATVTAQINVGEGQTLMAIYGIPSIQTAFMTKFDVNAHNSGNPANPTETDFTLLVNERPDLNTLAFINKSNLGTIATGSAHIDKEYKPYKTMPGPAIIKFQAISTIADTEGVSEFDLILVDN